MLEAEAILMAVERAKGRISLPDLKQKQLELLVNIVDGKSCFGVLPTGFGKSVCFYLPPIFLDNVRLTNFISRNKNIIINLSKLM